MTDSRPRATKSAPEACMSSSSSLSRTTSVRTWAPQGIDETLVDHHPQQRLEALLVGGEVVVVEEDLLGLLLLDLGDHVLGAAKAVLAPEHRRHRAEVAGEGAAPAGHDGRAGRGARCRRSSVRSGNGSVSRSAQRSCSSLCTVAPVAAERKAGDRLELALALQGLHELEHDRLAALAAGHEVGVLQRLVGHEGDVRAADDHGDATPPQTVGDRVGGRRGRRRAGEARRARRCARRPSRSAPAAGCRCARRGRAA